MKKSLLVIPALALFIFSFINLYALESIKMRYTNNHFWQDTTKKSIKNSKTPSKATPSSVGKGSVKKSSTAKPQNVEKGKNLISSSDCLVCHKVDSKIIGPAYNDVAKKYPSTKANIELLASKVINGGAGNWGPVPMSPHPSLSVEDAKEMVKYVLSLK